MDRPVQFEPLKRSMLPDMVVEQIKRMIIGGQLQPGDRLPPELALAEQFSVGRTSIREAIKALSLIGVLTRTNAGTVVSRDLPPLDVDYLTYRLLLKDHTLKETYEVRKLLEAEIAWLAAQRSTPEDRIALAAAIAQQEAARGDRTAFFQMDIQFHTTLAQAAGNTVLQSFYTVVLQVVVKAYEKLFRLFELDDFVSWSVENHRRILEAIERADANCARAAAYAAMVSTEQKLGQLLGWNQANEGGSDPRA